MTTVVLNVFVSTAHSSSLLKTLESCHIKYENAVHWTTLTFYAIVHLCFSSIDDKSNYHSWLDIFGCLRRKTYMYCKLDGGSFVILVFCTIGCQCECAVSLLADPFMNVSFWRWLARLHNGNNVFTQELIWKKSLYYIQLICLRSKEKEKSDQIDKFCC